jgi:hypothetical protein
MKIYLEYLWSLIKHKYYVIRAGRLLNVPFGRLIIHDWQKFTKLEFSNYAVNFFSGNKPDDFEEKFAYSWLHHENTAPHHWGYWIPRSGKYINTPLDMPMKYVREMVADWMGASKAYTNSWDIASWVNKNVPKFNISDETSNRISSLMYEMGYFLTDNCDYSWMAGSEFDDWIKSIHDTRR